MSTTNMSKEEVDKIANFLSQYSDQSEEIQKAHIKRLQDKYGVQNEDEIDIDQIYITVRRKRTAAIQ